MDKIYIYTMKHYSGIKSNETMPLAETWVQVDLETVILSEVRRRKTYTI